MEEVGIKYLNPAKLAMPFGVVTVTLPLAPLSTVAAIVVSLITANDFAATPPKVTAVAPVKPVPLMVSIVLGQAAILKEVIVGGGGVLQRVGTLAMNLPIAKVTNPGMEIVLVTLFVVVLITATS